MSAVTGRRAFLQTAGAACCGAVLCGQQAPRRREVILGGKRIRTIDMHAHVYVAEVWPLVSKRPEVDKALPELANGPMALDKKTLDARLLEMDRQGVDIHAISVHPAQHHYWADPSLSSLIVKLQNEKIASIVASRPDRFIGLGNVSLAHPDLAVEQMEYAVKRLGLRGFIIGGSVEGEELIAPRFEPFWNKAQEQGVVVFLHPAAGVSTDTKRYQGAGYLTNTVGNPLETTLALSHMIFDGFLDRFPNLRILAAHGGGFLPSYIGRSENCSNVRDDCRKMKRKPAEYLRGPQLFFDALVYTPENVRHLVATVGANQVVLGTDFAFDVSSKRPVDAVLETSDLTVAQQAAILGGNAEKLLGLMPA